MLAQGGLELIAPRGPVGERAGQFGEGFFRLRQRRLRRADLRIGAAEPCIGFARHIAQVLFFGVEPAERGFGVGGERALARQIGGKLLDAAIEFGDPFLGAGFLAFQRFSRDNQPLQRGGGFGFGLPQGGQRGGALGLAGRGLRLLAGARGDDPDGLVLAAPCVLELGAGAGPAQMKQ